MAVPPCFAPPALDRGAGRLSLFVSVATTISHRAEADHSHSMKSLFRLGSGPVAVRGGSYMVRRLAAGVCLAIGVGFVALALIAPPAQAADKFKIAIVSSLASAPILVADAKGFFKAEGFDAEFHAIEAPAQRGGARKASAP
jgi:hypothetical protein